MSKQMMIGLTIIAFATGLSIYYLANKEHCTNTPEEQWINPEEFKKNLTGHGFQIHEFYQIGTCYQVFGIDPKRHKVEVHFNPQNGKIKRSRYLEY